MSSALIMNPASVYTWSNSVINDKSETDTNMSFDMKYYQPSTHIDFVNMGLSVIDNIGTIILGNHSLVNTISKLLNLQSVPAYTINTKGGEQVMRKTKNIDKISRFRTLGAKWDGYDALPLSVNVIEKAEYVINNISMQPKIFPTACGSIQLEYEKKNGDYLEIEIIEDVLNVYKSIEDNEDEYTLPYDFEKLNGLVTEFYDE